VVNKEMKMKMKMRDMMMKVNKRRRPHSEGEAGEKRMRSFFQLPAE
jgi:hypothetical protein